MDGPSLSQIVTAGNVPRGSALERLAIATVTALAAIHEAGIVHRDFKPNNVIMGPDGARVIDFGIARALESTGTLSSAVVGTPAYMAPEQISGGRITPAADIFAWGCTIAYAANGVTLFGQDSIPAVMHRILHEQPDLGGLTGPLRDIVAACLAKDAAQRPTARQILLHLLGGAGSAAVPETLLTAGSHASATAPIPPGQTPTVPGPYAAPAAPWQPHRPVTERARSRRAGRVAALVTAAVAAVLAVVTFLPWARVAVYSGPIKMSDADVGGVHTVWGIVTLITAVIAVNIAITHRFAQRMAVAWATIPGGLAVVSIAGFLARRQDLHSKSPEYGKLTGADLRSMGMALHISFSPGVYVAVALAVAVIAAALVSPAGPPGRDRG